MATKNGTDRRFYYATAGKVGLVLMAVFLIFYPRKLTFEK